MVLEEAVLVAEDAVVVDVAEGVVASLITETVPPPRFATKTSLFPESYATKYGPEPTLTVATTVLVESLIAEAVLPWKFVTNTSPFPES